MDSGRKALLEKAREFGSLAHTLSWNEILSRSVTYRTLALYLGIQKEWWEEFERSFSFAPSNVKVETVKCFRWCCNAKSLPFVMNFLSNWFGRGVRISDIPAKALCHAYALVMSKANDQASSDSEQWQGRR